VYAKNQKYFFLLLLFRCWVVGAVEKKGANKMGLDGWLLRIMCRWLGEVRPKKHFAKPKLCAVAF
jgi:hypothetical protein